MAEKQTPNHPEQEFSAEEFKKLLVLGVAVGKSKLFELAGKVRERIDAEFFNPTAKLEKSLKAQYEDLVSKGVAPKIAEKVVMETVRETLQGLPKESPKPAESGSGQEEDKK